MYRRKSIRQIRSAKVPAIPTIPYECDHRYHPLSYYLNGGADPTGEQTDMSRVTTSDSAEDIANGCGVDARCDPRTNMFDIIEDVGVKNAQKAVEATNAGETAKE